MNTQAAVRMLLSEAARLRLAPALAQAAGSRPLHFVQPGEGEADLAFVSRDVTGLSTKHRVTPETQRFYDALRAATALQWVHVHSAGADRPVYLELHGRGVALTTSAGANADVVAQTALAGLLALARRFPQLQAAQRAHRWAPLIETGLPRDLRGQTAVVVGWGGIGQYLGAMLQALGLQVVAVRRQSAPPQGSLETVSYDDLDAVLPRADWLILACPLTDRTRQLIGARGARAPAVWRAPDQCGARGRRRRGGARGGAAHRPPGRRPPRCVRPRTAGAGLAAVGPAQCHCDTAQCGLFRCQRRARRRSLH